MTAFRRQGPSQALRQKNSSQKFQQPNMGI
jgi:hypothetical protein